MRMSGKCARAGRGRFDSAMVMQLPEPARRFFQFAIQPGTRLSSVAEIRMEGELSLGTKQEPKYQRWRQSRYWPLRMDCCGSSVPEPVRCECRPLTAWLPTGPGRASGCSASCRWSGPVATSIINDLHLAEWWQRRPRSEPAGYQWHRGRDGNTPPVG